MSLFGRAAAILLKPRRTWLAIAAEPRARRVAAHVAVLMLLPALAVFARRSLLDGSWPENPSAEWLAGALSWPAITYVGALLAVGALTLLVDALAPLFGTRRNLKATLDLVGYASTAVAVGCVLLATPLPAAFALLGAAYAVWLFQRGLEPLLDTRAGDTLAYTSAVAVAAGLIGLAVAAAVAPWVPASMGPRWASAERPPVPMGFDRTTVPALAEQMEATSRRIAAAASATMAASGVAPGGAPAASAAARIAADAASAPASAAASAVSTGSNAAAVAVPVLPVAAGRGLPLPAAPLRAVLPEMLRDWRRESIDAREARPGATLLAWARARYVSGERRVGISVADLGGPVVATEMRMRPHVELHRRTTEQVEANYNDGQRAIREVSSADGERATFTVILANGVMVELQAERLPMPFLKGLYAALDIGKLEALTRKPAR